jgi:hypothetical protein
MRRYQQVATWTVKTKVELHDTLEFEHEVEADSELEAETAAEDLITEEAILAALKAEGDPVGNATFGHDALTDALVCKTCDNLVDPDEADSEGNCADCQNEDEEEEEESEVAE